MLGSAHAARVLSLIAVVVVVVDVDFVVAFVVGVVVAAIVVVLVVVVAGAAGPVDRCGVAAVIAAVEEWTKPAVGASAVTEPGAC